MDTKFSIPGGIVPALITPFDENGVINDDAMRDTVDFCIESGCSMLFAVSSAGEFVHLDTDEACHLMDVVYDAAKGRVPVLAGVTASHIGRSIDLARYAQKIGCRAVVCSPPYYYPVTQGMIERHYEMLAEAVPDMPLVMYNIPLFSTPLAYDMVARVARIPNIIAMKDSSGSVVDMVHFMDSVRLAGADISIYSGREENVFAATMLGAAGAMVGTASIFPELHVRVFNATTEGDYKTARDLQFAMCHAIREIFSVPFPLGFKAAMEVRGFRVGPPKVAFSDADIQRANQCRHNLHEILSELCEYADIPLIRGRG